MNSGFRSIAIAVTILTSAHAIVAAIIGPQIINYIQKKKKPIDNNNNNNENDEDNDNSPLPLSILDFEREAKRHNNMSRLARVYFGYHDGEANTVTMARTFYKSIRLLPKILTGDLSNVDPSLTLFGTKVELPVWIAPTAFHYLACPKDAEVATARGAGLAGAGYCYNWMLASRGYEEVIQEKGVKWLHIYMFEERDIVQKSIELAEQSQAFSAIILTCDHPHNRVRDRVMPEFMSYQWPEEYLDRLFLPNQAAAGGDAFTVRDIIHGPPPEPDQKGPGATNSKKLNWDDVKWIKSLTSLPVVAKGILSAEDAQNAIDAKVDAIVVSNHGGRQFDGAPPAIEALPVITAIVNGRIPILIDTSIRTSTDILKALCLGASGVLLGRPPLWALSCGGSDALKRMFDTLRYDLIADMMSLGVRSLDELGPMFLWPPDRERMDLIVKSCGVSSSMFSSPKK